MNGFQDRMREPFSRSHSLNSPFNILGFSSDSAKSDTAVTALSLVHEAARIFRLLEDRAAESEALAERVIKSTTEKIGIAETRIQAAEAGRRIAEEALYTFKEKLQEFEKEFERTEARLRAAEGQLAVAEKRVIAAENRAAVSEAAVRKIEHALRTHFFAEQQHPEQRYASAA